MDISKWAFQNRNLIYFLVAVLLLGGAYSSYEMSKLEDPEIKVKLAMVVTPYPGASAHQVELEVTDVLEKSIRSMGHIDNVEAANIIGSLLICLNTCMALDSILFIALHLPNFSTYAQLYPLQLCRG